MSLLHCLCLSDMILLLHRGLFNSEAVNRFLLQYDRFGQVIHLDHTSTVNLVTFKVNPVSQESNNRMGLQNTTGNVLLRMGIKES